jgi:phosphatidylserine decarboxylase
MTEALNFLLTNRLPRIALSRFMGWFGKVENPLVARPSLALWRAFADLRLDEAKKTRFTSIHDCFTRELKDGARPVDPDRAVLSSPCDAIVGACGAIEDGRALQIKGSPYTVKDLIGEELREGTYATLRITSSMYHRFHAPCDLRVTGITRFAGDAWNVNPPALKRVEKLFCKNERAVIRTSVDVLLVPVAAILVSGIRLNFDREAEFAKGEEMGWFEHGSTIIVFAPAGFALCTGIEPGQRIRMGQALMTLPPG